MVMCRGAYSVHAVISTVSLCVLYILRVSCSSLVSVEVSGPRIIVSSFNMSIGTECCV